MTTIGIPISLTRSAFVDKSYAGMVLGLSPIAYWPLKEKSGTVAQCLVNAAQNGTYARNVTTMTTGEGIGDGNTAPLFDGVNDFVSIYSALFNTAWIGAEGALIIWVKSLDWTTDNLRYVRIGRSTSDEVEFQNASSGVAGRTYLERIGTATLNRVTYDNGSPAGWVCWGMAWSESGDTFKAFRDGVQVGSTLTGLGAFTGADLKDLTCAIGAQTTFPANLCNAYLAHVAVFNNPAVDMAVLAAL
jgi:hypothetical protein